MVCLAEGDAGAAAGNKAVVDGVEALEEATGPGRGAGGVGNARRIFSSVVYAPDPVVHVTLHLGLLSGVGRGGHCCDCAAGEMEVGSKERSEVEDSEDSVNKERTKLERLQTD